MNPNEPHIPPRLEADLRSAFGGFNPIPAELDRSVLGMAQGVAAGRRRRSRRLVLVSAASAAAAAAIALVWVVGPSLSHRTSAPAVTVAAAIPGDLNGDGKVDMLDALIEAQRINAGQGIDINADGKVDRDDVDALALSAVKLERGSL